MISTCKLIRWTWRKFANMPGNEVSEKISVGHYAPVFQTHRFDGESDEQLTPIGVPPGRHTRVDTHAHWRTNGLRGHFDIPSKKGGCPPAPEFTIEKRQQIAGSGEAFTTAPLKGLIGQTVDYQITVQNTGNVALVLSNFTDEHCDPGTISGGQGETPLLPGSMPSLGGKTTYTCNHVLTSLNTYENAGTITATPPPGDGSPITHTSNIVVVNGVAPEPGFTIEKLQMIEGSGGSFTTSPLHGEVGQTVNYEIVVKNTGNTSLTFSNFTDEHCDSGTIAGGPSGPLASNESATYTCKHVLTSADQAAGSFSNSATDTATPPGEAPITHTSNTVVVSLTKPAPAFTIEKLQKIEGSSGAFTSSPLSGEVGQTVNYEIVVKNTGNTSLTFSNFTDEHCDSGTIAGGPSGPLAPNESATYTCKHVLTSADQAAGSFSNSATDTATPPGEAPITHTSNTVVVSLTKPAPAFTIEKLQKIEGSSGAFTSSPLSGEVGQTVNYEIVVKNTGNTSLTFSNFTDEHCDSGTIAGGPSGALASNESATYTCKHVLTSADQTAGSFSNSATVTATPPGEAPITHTSNTVVVTLTAPPPPAQPKVFVGYGDGAANNHGGSNGFPTPWNGSPGVTFVGCGFGGSDTCPKSGGVDIYDAGAIRIDAPSGSAALSVTGARVVIGPCTYEPWPSLNVTVAAGHTLILTQTGKHQCTTTSTAEQTNFDTSESFLKSTQYQQFLKTGKCTGDGFVPAVTLTINGHTVTLSDSTRVLNTGGIDPDICTKSTETQNWTALALPEGQHFARVSHPASVCSAHRDRHRARRRGRSAGPRCAGAVHPHASATVLVKVL